jgi:protein-tyrosine phosphatase
MVDDGRPATRSGIAVMANRGFDMSAHRSRRLRPELVATADVIVGMARDHVREVVTAQPDAWPRTFTLKEIVRLGEERGPRGPGQPMGDWLATLHSGRRAADLLGDSEADDVADPMGRSRRVFERTAAEIEALIDRLAPLLAGGAPTAAQA